MESEAFCVLNIKNPTYLQRELLVIKTGVITVLLSVPHKVTSPSSDLTPPIHSPYFPHNKCNISYNYGCVPKIPALEEAEWSAV